MELVQDSLQRFEQIFGSSPEILVNAPGRVNLIGEHTDYNNGYVLPAAIDRSIYIAAAPRADRLLHLHTVDLQSSVVVDLDAISYNEKLLWANYPTGAARILQDAGFKLPGANFCIRGNIPIGAGLSSSAALSVASVMVFSILSKLSLGRPEVIEYAQRTETEFVGVQCGIMDQSISVQGKKNHALFLDCKTLEFEQVPFPDSVRIIICDTGSRRELANTAYNQRRAECDDAVRQLKRTYPEIKSLRDVSLDQFREVERTLSPIARRRTMHVLSENARVLESVAALRASDLETFGRLMTESHISLRDSYEVSSRELDAFVDIAVDTKGVCGARMTGAGFGGSAICVVEQDKIDNLVYRLRTEYPRRAGRSITIYISSIEDGAIARERNHGWAEQPIG